MSVISFVLAPLRRCISYTVRVVLRCGAVCRGIVGERGSRGRDISRDGDDGTQSAVGVRRAPRSAAGLDASQRLTPAPAPVQGQFTSPHSRRARDSKSNASTSRLHEGPSTPALATKSHCATKSSTPAFDFVACYKLAR